MWQFLLLIEMAVTPFFQPIDSSANGYTLFELRHQPLSYNNLLDRLILVNRAYSPSGALNTHSAPGDLSFWIHEVAYNQSLGPARYPTALAGFVPYITFPVLVGGVWGGFVVIKWDDWFSAPECSVFVTAPVFFAVAKQLPNSNLTVITQTVSGDILYWTFSSMLDTIIAADTLASNAEYSGFDINGGIAYVFYFNQTGLYYRTTTDGIIWSSEQEWNIPFTPPYTGYMHYINLAVTDNGEPIIVFDYWSSDDPTYPYYGRIYVSYASGVPPIDLTASLPDTEAMYPTIACGGNYAVVIFNTPRNNLPDSQAWMDILMCVSTDNGRTWSEPQNITWSNTTSRIGLQQIAKRVDLIRNRIYYIFASDMVVNCDPFWHIWWEGGTDPMYIYFGYNSILGSAEQKAQNLKTGSVELDVYPNPFSQKAEIRYIMQDKKYTRTAVSLKIYDSSGRLVKFFNHLIIQPSGQILWDGTDDRGFQLSNGIYFMVLEALDMRLKKKIIIVR